MATIAIKRPLVIDPYTEPSKRRRGQSPSSLQANLDPSFVNEPDVASIKSFTASDASEPSTRATSTAPGTPLKYPRREKKFVCDYPGCGKAYTRPVRLAEHQRSHTNERPFVCDREGCEKAFLRDSHLKHHIKAHHDDVRNFVCDWPGCGKGFATGQRMRAHRKRHDELEQCKCTGFPPCEQYFRKPETLRQHILSVHLNEAAFVCEHVTDRGNAVCGKTFKAAWSLKQHRDRDHAGPRYLCEICTSQCTDQESSMGAVGTAEVLAFVTYGELQQHMKRVHPPTCSECEVSFETTGQLRAHRDIHHLDIEERRTVACTEPGCDRMFTKKGNMLAHVKSAHEKKKFVCGEVDLPGGNGIPEWDGSGACGKGFTTKATLVKHIRTQHLHLPEELSKGKQKRKERRLRMALEQQQQQQGDETLTMLTGVGYEDARRFPCTQPDCSQRFKRAYDLELHLEGAHGFDQEDAMLTAEAVREREALSGGDFWVGGDDFDEPVDEELAYRLNAALGSGDAMVW